MVVVDLKRRELVTVLDFQERLEAWRKTGAANPCPLRRKPLLRILNSFINHEGYYDMNRGEIITGFN